MSIVTERYLVPVFIEVEYRRPADWSRSYQQVAEIVRDHLLSSRFAGTTTQYSARIVAVVVEPE